MNITIAEITGSSLAGKTAGMSWMQGDFTVSGIYSHTAL